MRSLLHRARAIALRGGGDVTAALVAGMAAIEAADTVEAEPDGVILACEVRATQALATFADGDADRADRLATEAVTRAEDADLRVLWARCLAQRGLIRQRAGRPGAAEDLAEAIGMLRDAGDRFHEGQARLNRGVAFAYAGELDRAERDLVRASDCFGAADGEPDRARLAALHNLGYVRGRRGDHVGALRAFREAIAGCDALGLDTTLAEADRSEVLLDAGLVGDAVDVARSVLETPDAPIPPADRAEILLRLAQAELADGRLRAASLTADDARQALAAQGRDGWAVLAASVGRRAQLRASEPPDDIGALLTEARGLAATLRSEERPVAAVELLVDAADAAARHGRTDDVDALLEACDPLPRHLPLAVIAQIALVRARRIWTDDPTAARAVVDEALATIDDARVTAGAGELAAGLGAHRAELLRLGLSQRLAAEMQPDDLARWVERTRDRAPTTLARAVVDDPSLEPLAAEARDLRARLARSEQISPAETSRLRQLERALREAVWEIGSRSGVAHADARPEAPPDTTMAGTAAALRAAVHVLAETDDGGLLVLHADPDGTVTSRLADLRAADAAAAATKLGFLLQRCVAESDPVRAARARDRARTAAVRLRRALAGDDDGADRVLVVPTAGLFATPWSLVFDEAEVAVAPNLRRARGVAGLDGGTRAAIEGPGLTHAAAEVASIPADRRLLGDEATVAAALDAIVACDVVHLACHGQFRDDNPLFSALHLHDGPLWVHDVEALERVPRLWVLSACQSALSGARPGDELLGLTASLLGVGATTIIGSVTDVTDVHARDLMPALHESIAAGLAPATALHRARAGHDDSAAAWATALSFTCIGAGWPET